VLERRYGTVAIVGAGDFTGAAIAKKFASRGFTIFAARRNVEKLAPLVQEIEALEGCIFIRAVDASKEPEISSFLQQADREAPLEVCIFNAGTNMRASFLDTTEGSFREAWETACYAGFLTGREAARLMLPRHRGAIFFTGCAASLRGGIGQAAFSAAKFGLKAVAQSAAREFGPKNIHVAHLVVGGVCDRYGEREGEQPLPCYAPNRVARREGMAETYWQLYNQPCGAWSSEIEILPFGSGW
jgi:NAD(P)-dependent dehydrogenase (short-subunit alcohol dehydrogenase family)